MTLFRRLVLLSSLMFWQGGFMFYGSVVVTIGSQVLHSDTEQGFITRRVTNWLNLAGAVALIPWAWDLAADPAPLRRRQRIRWVLWLVLLLTLLAQTGVHVLMDAQLDTEAREVLDRQEFRRLHRWYLRLSSAQWLAGLALLVLTLDTWRRRDAENGSRPLSEALVGR